MSNLAIAAVVLVVVLVLYRNKVKNWLMPAKPEVYYVGDYKYDLQSAKGVCSSLGGTLATPEQLKAAHEAGADWCSTGRLSDGSAAYPINTSIRPGCATEPKIAPYLPADNLTGATCYGPKPSLDTASNMAVKVVPFNETSWSMYR